MASELVERGRQVHLLTDSRADAFAAGVPGVAVHCVRSGRLGGGPVRAAHGLAEMAAGALQARRLLRQLSPQAIIGFGGYPSVPTMLAAASLGLATLIHEQNAVLGRANRLLAPRMRRIAIGFPETSGMRPTDRARAVHTGNPVRPAILAIGEPGYTPPLPGGTIELLILGGSQGARVLSEIVPPALAALPAGMRAALRVSQQTRPEDLAAVTEAYAESRHCRRDRKLFRRCAAADGARTSGDLPGRRLDCGRALGDRPAGVADSLPARNRRPSNRERSGFRRSRGRMGRSRRRISAPILSPLDCRVSSAMALP